MKALLYGVAGAITAGVMLGGWLRYDERISELPEGPQQLISGPPTRLAEQPPGGMVLTVYNGEVPDYVVGTDWLHGMQDVAYQDPDSFPEYAYSADDYAEDASAYAPSNDDLPVYPSIEGDILEGLSEDWEPPPLPPISPPREPDALDQMMGQIEQDGQIAAERIAGRPS